jgi:hypothetical protein
MEPTDLSYMDIFLSAGFGISVGWLVGGSWNLLMGKTWNGHSKQKERSR